MGFDVDTRNNDPGDYLSDCLVSPALHSRVLPRRVCDIPDFISDSDRWLLHNNEQDQRHGSSNLWPRSALPA